MYRFTCATDSSHKIEIESKEISIDMPQDKEPAIQWHSECCIYKVPKRLREVNDKAYTPKLISIGPIHRGNSELKDMERRKQTYCDKFFRRTNKAKEEFERIVEENKKKICDCYAEEITQPCEEEFVKMILLDSIFIIELFWMSANKEDRNEYILSKPWLKEGITYDLILLENQLPLFILNELYSQSGDEGCFITLACNFFFPEHKELPTEMEGVKHLTDLRRNFYRPPPLDHLLNPKTDSPIEHLYRATKLVDNAGLIFQKPKQFVGERELLDIKLKKPWDIRPTSCLMNCFINFSGFKCLQTRLVVPQFVVDDGTEELFRNLMALEQCHYPSKAYICNYIVLLDYLINSKEDVELLVDKRVIVNLLGSNKAVAEMVNKLCLEIVEVDSYYRHIADDLNNLYDSHWNQNLASLRNVYFKNIWRGSATVVGVLVLLITIFTFLKPFVFKNI
ncbi:UPF0481 protein At3g47200-like [Quercus lobata]|uniref:Uncharacterized protein n=1 Tax=Quercus lobata TaxID=97700 RepID=A0A7N2R2X2_QUELO|nr:UPF0481 protein At3g47200-like [Quercus lobata]XP_030967539.1 UPF0481 protein At3g47200-like [Quercus lobata]